MQQRLGTGETSRRAAGGSGQSLPPLTSTWVHVAAKERTCLFTISDHRKILRPADWTANLLTTQSHHRSFAGPQRTAGSPVPRSLFLPPDIGLATAPVPLANIHAYTKH